MKTVRWKTREKIRGDGNREREQAFIVRGDCEVIRPFVAKVIEQFFSFFFYLAFPWDYFRFNESRSVGFNLRTLCQITEYSP